MTDDLIAFLRARFDEDEKTAACEPSGRRVHPADLQWAYQPDDDPDVPGGDVIARGHRIVLDSPVVIAAHIARHDPARVLREVEAKRRIVDACERRGLVLSEINWVVRVLALPYADHDDYREVWRP